MDVRQSPFPLWARITAVWSLQSSCMCPQQLVQFWFEEGDWGIYRYIRNDTEIQRCTFFLLGEAVFAVQLSVHPCERASTSCNPICIYTHRHSVQGPGGQEPAGRLTQVQPHSDGWETSLLIENLSSASKCSSFFPLFPVKPPHFANILLASNHIPIIAINPQGPKSFHQLYTHVYNTPTLQSYYGSKNTAIKPGVM